jgi:hypothetical protein
MSAPQIFFPDISLIGSGSYLPVPAKTTDCLAALVLSVTVRVAARAPDADGVNVTVTRHVARGLIVPADGQVLAGVNVKSEGFVPVMVMLLIFKATVTLVSVSVELLAALVVPTVTAPKLKEAGSSVAVAKAVVPVPLRATVWDPVLVLSKTVSVADRAPAAAGLKVIDTRQVV